MKTRMVGMVSPSPSPIMTRVVSPSPSPCHLLALALLVVFNLQMLSVESCPLIIGGSSAIAPLMRSILARCPFDTCAGAYYLMSSSALGISKFNDGTYCIGIGDTPMSTTQEASGIAKKVGKLTIPLAIATYGIFAGGSGGTIRMTAKETKGALFGRIKTWDKIKGNKGALTGPITPYIQVSGSGINLLLKNYWKAAGAGIVKPFDESQWYAPGCSYYSSASNLCQGLALKVGSIGASQIKVCAIPGVFEIAIENAAKKYIRASDVTSRPIQAIPRTLPKRTISWSNFKSVYQVGGATPPLVNLAFAFAQAKAMSSVPLGALAKKVLLYINNNVIAAASASGTLGYDPLDASIISVNAAAITAAG